MINNWFAIENVSSILWKIWNMSVTQFQKNYIDRNVVSLFDIRGSDQISLRLRPFQFRLTAFVLRVSLRTLFASTCRPTPKTTFSCGDLGRWKRKNRERGREKEEGTAEGVRGERPGGGGGNGQGLRGWQKDVPSFVSAGTAVGGYVTCWSSW